MIPVTEIYGRKASDGEINWITAIAMTAFHVGAVAAFFFIDWGAIADDVCCGGWPARSASAWAITAC